MGSHLRWSQTQVNPVSAGDEVLVGEGGEGGRGRVEEGGGGGGERVEEALQGVGFHVT